LSPHFLKTAPNSIVSDDAISRATVRQWPGYSAADLALDFLRATCVQHSPRRSAQARHRAPWCSSHWLIT